MFEKVMTAYARLTVQKPIFGIVIALVASLCIVGGSVVLILAADKRFGFMASVMVAWMLWYLGNLIERAILTPMAVQVRRRMGACITKMPDGSK
jgi:hypothetical protein